MISTYYKDPFIKGQQQIGKNNTYVITVAMLLMVAVGAVVCSGYCSGGPAVAIDNHDRSGIGWWYGKKAKEKKTA